MKYHACFAFTPNGWVCRKVWNILDDFEVVGDELYINVRVPPKVGFCKRPHFYGAYK